MILRKLVLSLAVVSSVAGCGGPLKYNVTSSARAPGADASIVADVKKEQGQTQLEIKATNLPPPSRVAESATVYLIFQRKDASASWLRLGGLSYDEGSREGRWEGSVPETGFDLAISAENEANVASPSGDVVFSQRVN